MVSRAERAQETPPPPPRQLPRCVPHVNTLHSESPFQSCTLALDSGTGTLSKCTRPTSSSLSRLPLISLARICFLFSATWIGGYPFPSTMRQSRPEFSCQEAVSPEAPSSGRQSRRQSRQFCPYAQCRLAQDCADSAPSSRSDSRGLAVARQELGPALGTGEGSRCPAPTPPLC